MNRACLRIINSNINKQLENDNQETISTKNVNKKNKPEQMSPTTEWSLCIYLYFVSLCLSIYIYPSIFLSSSVSLSLYPSVSLSLSLSLSLLYSLLYIYKCMSLSVSRFPSLLSPLIVVLSTVLLSLTYLSSLSLSIPPPCLVSSAHTHSFNVPVLISGCVQVSLSLSLFSLSFTSLVTHAVTIRHC